MSVTPPRLPDLLALQLWQLAVSFEARLAAELSDLGLSVAAFRLIGEVMRAPAGLRQGELARRLGVSAPTVSVAVAKLEKDGLLHRVQDPDDPRARRVCLAPNADLSAGVDVLTRLEVALTEGRGAGALDDARALLADLDRRLQPPEQS